jgi:thioredoxin-related protein
MKFSNLIFVIACTFLVPLMGQNKLAGQNKVRWYSWQEAMAKYEKTPRKLLIDVITDKCTFCKKMDANTFNNDKIAKYINENFYAIRFNAEDKADITFKGQTYSFIKTFNGGYHELAADILDGNLQFPSAVFLNESLAHLHTIVGYQEPSTFSMVINYYGEDFYKEMAWRKFVRDYNSSSCDKKSFPVTKKN